MSDSQTGSNRRRFLQGTGAAAVSLGLAGCSSGGDATPTDEETPTPDDTPTPAPTDTSNIPTGGTFRFGMTQSPAGVNPLSTSSAYSWVILDLIYETGTSIDPVNFEVHPNVYTEWEFEELSETGDNDAPNVAVRFKVRDGLTFNDGTELSVSDVIFTYNYLNEQNPGRYTSTMDPITGVAEGPDDWDVELTMNRPIGTYDSTQLGIPILPEHIWSEVDDYQGYEPQNNDFGGPVGLGPGVLTRYEPDTSVEVSFTERQGEYTLSDLDWYGNVQGIISGGPFVDAIRLFIYGSDNALNQAFLNGDLDAVYGNINTSRISDVQDAEGLSLVPGFDTGYGHYSFNLRRKPIDDLVFRQVLGMTFDDIYWTQRLNEGYEQEGDFVMPPGYTAVRPETEADVEVLTDPASQAFHFREDSETPGAVDVEAVRSFLTSGTPITGESGTFAGMEYPGSLTGVSASQTEGKYEITFGDVQTEVLANAGADQEIRFDGQTLPELRGGEPLVFYINPADNAPKSAQMMENYIATLREIGIPVSREVNTFNTMLDLIYANEDFDLFPMGWVSLSPFATSTLYGLFHSDNADDRTQGNNQTLLNNAMGYGLFEDATADDLISQARSEMNAEERNSLARQAVERIYLDFPTMVNSYGKMNWPVNDADWDGFISNIAGPGDTYLASQFMQIHQAE